MPNMRTFVTGRNGQGDRASQHDDLKLAVPALEEGLAQGFKPYSQKHDRGKSSQPRSISRPNEVTREDIETTRPKSKLADLSSMGETTDTPAEAYHNPSNGRLPGNQEPHGQNLEENYMVDDDDADYRGIDTQLRAQTSLPQRGSFGDQRNKTHSTNGSLKAIQGDSYPPTTSGQPSVSDHHEPHEQVHEKPQHRQQEGAQNGHVESNRPRKHRLKDGLQNQAEPSILPPKAVLLDDVFDDAARELEQTQTGEEPHTVPRQYTQSAPQVYKHHPDQVVTQTQTHHRRQNETPKAADAQYVGQQQGVQQGPVQTTHYPGMPTLETTQPQRPHHQEPPLLRQTPQEPQAKPQPQDFAFDYPLQDLNKMTYPDLQSADFDLYSAKRKRELPKQCQTDNLSVKLEAGLRLDDDLQLKLFTTLSMCEWEEAGDWFLDRFKETIDNLQKARKKKRAELAAFEAKVRERHEEVQRKKTAIEGAVEGMRAGAQNVLSGQTPRKS